MHYCSINFVTCWPVNYHIFNSSKQENTASGAESYCSCRGACNCPIGSVPVDSDSDQEEEEDSMDWEVETFSPILHQLNTIPWNWIFLFSDCRRSKTSLNRRYCHHTTTWTAVSTKTIGQATFLVLDVFELEVIYSFLQG